MIFGDCSKMERHNSCLRMSKCDVGMASLSMRFRVDADFFQDAARVDVDFFLDG